MKKPASRVSARDRRLLVLYGITAAEYDVVLAYQGGKCAICCRPPKRVRLGVDHRHSDGLTRGLLCRRCNMAVAYLADDSTSAIRLGVYLNLSPVTRALGRRVYGRQGRSTRRWRSKRERRERLEAVGLLVSDR